MAWQRDEANLGISGATAYSYTEVDWSVNATHAVYRHIGGVTSPYNFGATATSTLQWWESGTWHDYAGPDSHYFSGYGDQPILDVEDSFVRQAADRTVSLGCYTTMMGGSGRAYIDFTVPHLAPSVTWASSNPVVRNSDNSITLTWNAPSLEYSAMCLEVSTDGGSWSQFAVLWNTATSYTWTGCSAGHSYQFRIRTNYLASYSDYDVCATVIVNTPLPPESISTAAAGGTNVTVNLVNPSTVATSVEYQVSTDGGTTWGATQTSANLTSFTATVTGTGKIRVRNKNATGESAWLESGAITTICPPAAPTLVAPTGNLNLSTAGGNVTFEWRHNTLDGSAQTAAKLRYSTDGGTTWASTINMSPKLTETYTMAIPWAAGTTVTWQVKTKGAATTGGSANDGYSDWSASQTFNVYTAPTLNITSPSASVTSMPVSISATYSDMAGFTCAAATVTLKQGDRVLLTKPATVNGTAITSSIDLSEVILDNATTYTVVLDVRSSSGLQSSSNATFTTAFAEPQAGDLSIVNDADTGYASLVATIREPSELSSDETTFKWKQDCRLYKARTDSSGAVTESWNAITWNIESGHKYFLEYNVLNATKNNIHIYIAGSDIGTTVSNSTGVHSKFITASASGKMHLINSAANTNIGNNVYFIEKIILLDLTYIFGAGNEPTDDDAIHQSVQYSTMLERGELYNPNAGTLQPLSVGIPSVDGDYLREVTIKGDARIVPKSGNLIHIDTSLPQTQNSVTFSANGDGGIKVVGTSSAAINKAFWRVTLVNGQTYTMVADFPIYNSYYYLYNSGTSSSVKTNIKNSTTFTATSSMNASLLVGIYIPANQYVNTVLYPHLNTGSTALPFEQYCEEHVLTVTGKGSIAGGVITHQPISLATSNETYSDVLGGEWLAAVGDTYDVAHVGATTTIERKIGCRAYQAGDENDPDVLTDGSSLTYYVLGTPIDVTVTGTSYQELEEPDILMLDAYMDTRISAKYGEGIEEAASISVARLNADGLTPLITDGASGAGAVDKYAPLNTPYQYAVTTKSSANAVKTVYVDNEIVTDLWFAYWGENIASAKWNPDNGGIQVSRPQKTRVYYAGRKDPVSYDGAAIAWSETPSWMFLDKDEVQPFVQLIEDGGRGVYKSCDGDVYHADFEVTLNPKYIAIGYYGGMMLNVTRIAGDLL